MCPRNVSRNVLKIFTLIFGFCLVCSFALAEDSIVEEIIDGNTIKLTSGEVVRLIGVDIPSEREEEGTEFVRNLKFFIKGEELDRFLKGTEARLEFDVQRSDQDGNLLAYVFVGLGYSLSDHVSLLIPENYYLMDNKEEEYTVFLNATLIKSGYATPKPEPPDMKYADLFQKLYEEARRNKRGLWENSGDTTRNVPDNK